MYQNHAALNTKSQVTTRETKNVRLKNQLEIFKSFKIKSIPMNLFI